MVSPRAPDGLHPGAVAGACGGPEKDLRLSERGLMGWLYLCAGDDSCVTDCHGPFTHPSEAALKLDRRCWLGIGAASYVRRTCDELGMCPCSDITYKRDDPVTRPSPPGAGTDPSGDFEL